MAFEALLMVGMLALVTGVLATIYFYVGVRQGGSPELPAPSLLRYFAFAIVCAFGAYMAGSALGILAACSVRNAGNLCGIWGALGSGPLLAGAVLWSYGPWWRRRLSK